MFATSKQFPSEILPGLFVGDSTHGSSCKILQALNIRAVVNATKQSYLTQLKGLTFIPHLIFLLLSDMDKRERANNFEEPSLPCSLVRSGMCVCKGVDEEV